MTESALATLNRGRAEAFERALENASADPLPTDSVRQLGLLIPKAVRDALEVRELWEEAWRRFEECPVADADCQQLGETLRERIAQWRALLTDLEAICQDAQARGGSIPHAEQLGPAIREIERLRTALENNWPWANRLVPAIDPKMIEASQIAIARGEAQDLEDLIHGLQGEGHPAG